MAIVDTVLTESVAIPPETFLGAAGVLAPAVSEVHTCLTSARCTGRRGANRPRPMFDR